MSRALITIRKDDGFDIGAVVSYWDGSADLAKEGVGYLVHGLLDNIVDGYFAAVQAIDEQIEDAEDQLCSDSPRDQGAVQRRSFELRKSLVMFRRVVLPMREVVNAVMRRDLHVMTDVMQPYYQDVYDHVLRATEWTESLRDLVTTILETNLTVQANRMNVITKKVTSWAAIVAVPTLVNGLFRLEGSLLGVAPDWGPRSPRRSGARRVIRHSAGPSGLLDRRAGCRSRHRAGRRRSPGCRCRGGHRCR